MIDIFECGESYGKMEYVTYNIGEIVRLECAFPMGQGDGELFTYYDSKGVSFQSHLKPNAVRYYSLSGIEALRKELLPIEYQRLNSFHFWCGDPRVVWCFIVSLWLWCSGCKQRKHVTEEITTKYLNENLPSWQEACVWMVRNDFVLMPSKVEQRSNRYLEDYAALKFPPKVDWSIFPDYKDN